MNKERPKVGVTLIVRHDKKVLLGERRSSFKAHTWGFPGGHLEYGETWVEGAVRELKEEVGIKVSNIHFGAVTNDIIEEEQKHYITIFLVCDYQVGELKSLEPDKINNWQWFPWDKLPTPLFPSIINLVKQGFDPFDRENL